MRHLAIRGDSAIMPHTTAMDENFNEHLYLEANPDVKTAVEDGMPSGWFHYEVYGKAEGRNPYPGFRKTDIVRHLSRKFGKRHFLEFCTPVMETRYYNIDRTPLKTCRRLMYHCPDDYEDDMTVDYRVNEFDIDEAFRQMAADGIPDICLLDAWPTYDCTLRDLTALYNLMPVGAIIVLHGALPSPEITVSYKALLDFASATPGMTYCVVDTDGDCGIIVKNRRIKPVWTAGSDAPISAQTFVEQFEIEDAG